MSIFSVDTNDLWNAVCRWCRKGGRVAARQVLLLWYVMRSPETPAKDKWLIAAALAYLVLPVDILDARRLPLVGWLDEAVSLAVVVRKVARHITPEVEARADALLEKWFPEYAEYEVIEQ